MHIHEHVIYIHSKAMNIAGTGSGEVCLSEAFQSKPKEQEGPSKEREERHRQKLRSGENGRNGRRRVVWLLHGIMGAGKGTDAIFF